jgi:hypothetical protein
VTGEARLVKGALVSENAEVGGGAWICSADIGGHAQIDGTAAVYPGAVVTGHCHLSSGKAKGGPAAVPRVIPPAAGMSVRRSAG